MFQKKEVASTPEAWRLFSEFLGTDMDDEGATLRLGSLKIVYTRLVSAVLFHFCVWWSFVFRVLLFPGLALLRSVASRCTGCSKCRQNPSFGTCSHGWLLFRFCKPKLGVHNPSLHRRRTRFSRWLRCEGAMRNLLLLSACKAQGAETIACRVGEPIEGTHDGASWNLWRPSHSRIR